MSIYSNRRAAMPPPADPIRPPRRLDVLGAAGRDLVAGESLCTDASYAPTVFHLDGVRSTSDLTVWTCPDCGYDSANPYA